MCPRLRKSRAGSKGLEKTCLGSGRGLSEPLIPVAKEASELLLESAERGNLSIYGGEAFAHEGPNAAAGSSAALSFPQYPSELVEREPHDERAANEEDARKRIHWIASVSSLRPRRTREQPLALVMAKGVGADSRKLRQLAGPERPGIPFHRFPTSIESPVS